MVFRLVSCSSFTSTAKFPLNITPLHPLDFCFFCRMQIMAWRHHQDSAGEMLQHVPFTARCSTVQTNKCGKSTPFICTLFTAWYTLTLMLVLTGVDREYYISVRHLLIIPVHNFISLLTTNKVWRLKSHVAFHISSRVLFTSVQQLFFMNSIYKHVKEQGKWKKLVLLSIPK